ncbi:hypothetical protein D9619_006632 [Psilocybe cf. subviscida]|uniref:HNH nuclease domain-containing protein n=1 Tax=Psilocybe cf. subviscida TaxID=2480587 RepID=A0A8H5B441_9AGAR|nr:hypothetical protein D9619_006632 [Psilocybe cf. subviscida]
MLALPCHAECYFDAHGNSVWSLLLEAEQEALAKWPSDHPQHNSPLVAIRVLGFLLKDVWGNARRWNLGDTAYSYLIKKINVIRRGEKEKWFDDLVELGLVYRNSLLCMYRSDIDVESEPLSDDCLSPYYVFREWIAEGMNYEPPTKQTIRQQALLRDGFHCAVCGVAEIATCQRIDDDDTAEEPVSGTDVAYLSPKRSRPGYKECSTSAFDMLTLFGLERQAESLHGDAVHSLYNVLTLEVTLCELFRAFRLWLEPVEGQEHVYKAQCTLPRLYIPLPPCITLRVSLVAEAKAAEKNAT